MNSPQKKKHDIPKACEPTPFLIPHFCCLIWRRKLDIDYGEHSLSLGFNLPYCPPMERLEAVLFLLVASSLFFFFLFFLEMWMKLF